MRTKYFLGLAAVSLLLASFSVPSVFAQFQVGGVDKKGSWHVGEGLKQGDYFSYSMCHVHYKECSPFELDMWIKGDKQVGSETMWLAEVVVYDGKKIIKGEMELGKVVAPEPTGGTENLSDYQDAFRSSIVWLSAFATADIGISGKGPKDFSAASWGKIANIGGEQIIPTSLETVTVSAGTWETVLVSWKTGGHTSKVWVADEFPFPIKAQTLTHAPEGIPPPEYTFELLEYHENVKVSPFVDIYGPPEESKALGCEPDFEKEASIKKSTINHDYQIHAYYGPEEPMQGCEMQWLINFISKYDDTEFLNQVQYDLQVTDSEGYTVRSIAEEENRSFLYSPSGQAVLDMVVKEDPGDVTYVIVVYGLSPENILPSTGPDFLKIAVPIQENDKGAIGVSLPPSALHPTTPPVQNIPAWVKSNAGWWADGTLDDDSFVTGIQFLMEEGLIQIPPTGQKIAGESSGIPSWVKSNAGWWSQGLVSDDDFISGIQYLVENSVINIQQ